MIVRTSPITLPAPDAIRAMERLESQLRRAADDLAASLVDMRAAVEAPLVRLEHLGPDLDGRCGKWMKRAAAPCGRNAGHDNPCRSRFAMDNEARAKSGWRKAADS